jgi:hypothetical protein
MDSEHRNLMIKTLSLINHTRHEISQLHEEVQSSWNAVGQSQRLLSRVERHRQLGQIEGVQEQPAVIAARENSDTPLLSPTGFLSGALTTKTIREELP